MKEKCHVGPNLKKIKKKQNKNIKETEKERQIIFIFILFIFSSLTSLFDIRKSDRQNSSRQEAKCFTR